MATIEATHRLQIGTRRPELAEEKKIRPVMVWATIGAICLVWAVAMWVMWLTHLPEPTPVGPSKVPTAMVWNLIVQQFLGMVGFAFFIYWFVVRPWRRQGHLTFDGMFVIAATGLYWQDYLSNMSQVVSTYNSGLLNWGSWYNYMPGWLPPNGREFVEAPFIAASWYAFGIAGTCMALNFIMRRAKARWPGMGIWGLIGFTVVLCILLDLVCETLYVYSGFFHYGGIPGPKLFAGHYYEFPLIESLLWGPSWAAFACFRYFRNDKGESFVEKGIDEVSVGRKGKSALRLLAIFGLCSALFGIYNVAMFVVGRHAKAWPEDVLKRSYFTHTQCGAGTDLACSGGDIPLPRRGSFTITPDGKLGNPSGKAEAPKQVPSTKCPDSPYDAPLTGHC